MLTQKPSKQLLAGVLLTLTAVAGNLNDARSQQAPLIPKAAAIRNESLYPDTIADAVLGQNNFTAIEPGAGSARFNTPAGIGIAPDGRLFVGDYLNHRVLSWPNAASFSNGAAADFVLGQLDLNSNEIQSGAAGLGYPERVTVDSTGVIYVADTEYNRVMQFRPPYTIGMAASLVFGQGDTGVDFEHVASGVGAHAMNQPRGMAIDAQNNLYLADDFNHRVLVFLAPASTPITAAVTPDYVIGQPDFTSRTPTTSRNGLHRPTGVAIDKMRNLLYVSEWENNRVLVFRLPITSNAPDAIHVLGQGVNGDSFTTNSPADTASGLYHPTDVALNAAGDVFVSEFSNSRVLRFRSPATTQGVPTPIGEFAYGQGFNGTFFGGLQNPGASEAYFYRSAYGPLSLALDNTGGLLVADTGANRVLRFAADAQRDQVEGFIPNEGGALLTPPQLPDFEFGAETLDTDARVTVQPVAAEALQAPAELSVYGHAFDLTASSYPGGTPLQAQAPFRMSQLITEPVANAEYAFYSFTGGEWRRDPASRYDSATRIVAVDQSRFSRWALFFRRPVPQPSAPDRLRNGEALTRNARLISANGVYEFVMQPDCNAVIYRRGVATWATNTSRVIRACPWPRFRLTPDGLLVLEHPIRTTRGYIFTEFDTFWRAPLSPNGATAELVMQDDGNLVLYRSGIGAVWASNTVFPTREIDVNISLYRNAADAATRARYEDIIGYFADAVYEMSNGAHRIRNVEFTFGSGGRDTAHVIWNASEWPRALTTGYGKAGGFVYMGDLFPFPDENFDALSDTKRRDTGYVLAHEWGHYFYGIYDQYKQDSQTCDPTKPVPVNPYDPHACDHPVTPSIMNSQWNYVITNDLGWLNFNTDLTETQRNANYRVYKASAWSVLKREASQDPPSGMQFAFPIRTHWPELKKVAPANNQAAAFDLPSANARQVLRVQWISTAAQIQSAASEQSSPDLPQIEAFIDVHGGSQIYSPKPVMLVAHAILTNGVVALPTHAYGSVHGPTGAVSTIQLNDAGVAPDIEAQDGFFSGFVPYSSNGEHAVTVTLASPPGVAQRLPLSGNLLGTFAATAGPGEPPPPPPLPIGVSTTTTSTFFVSDYRVDDHGNILSEASELFDDNTQRFGSIELAGDSDVFVVTSTQSAPLILRAFGFSNAMIALVTLRDANGQFITELNQRAGASDILSYRFQATAGTRYYIEVRHADARAQTGGYAVSIGTGITPQETTWTQHLPMLSR